MAPISESINREQVRTAYEDKREQLGDEQFDKLVKEISDVTWEHLKKLDTHPWTGGPGSHVTEKWKLEKDRTMKVLSIKQKYGV